MNASGTGLDWDAIRARYIQRASPEEAEAQLRSLSRPWGAKGESALVPKTQAERAKINHPHAVSREKHELACDYYAAKNKVPWIAQELQLSEATVRRILRDEGVYDANRDRGRK